MPIKIFNKEMAVDLLVLFAMEVFIAVYFDIRLLFTDTIVTGGDTASWHAIAHHLETVLLPQGRLTGWNMGNFAGYPDFSFYFIPPFLLAALPSWLFGIPLGISLKWAIMSGIFLMPIATYFGLRKLDYDFPVPVIGAGISLLLLFNENYTMFGGNVLSTFAGEFCYMFAFAIFALFIGTVLRGARTDRWLVNGMLLGLIGLSHLFVFIPAGIVIIYLFFTTKQLHYIIKTCLAAFGLMAFWFLPLLVFRHPYTTPVYMIWQDYANWRYSLAAIGLLLLFVGPALSLRSIADRTRVNQWATISIAAGMVFISVTLLGMWGMYGPKLWATGLSAPILKDSPLGLSVATLIRFGFIPLAIALGAGVVAIGSRLRFRDEKWQSFAYSTWATSFFAALFILFSECYMIFARKLGGSDLITFALSPVVRHTIYAVWLAATGTLFFLYRPFRRYIISVAPVSSRSRLNLLLALIAGCLIAYACAHILQVPDIRFLPPILFAVGLIFAGEIIGPVLSDGSRYVKLASGIFIPFFCLLIVIFSAVHADGWFLNNFKGYEGTQGFTEFQSINAHLRHSYKDQYPDPLNAPRVAYEKADGYGIYGGDRVFESLFYFSGRQTLEGIHYASAFGSKFMAFLQTRFSRDIKTPASAVFAHLKPDTLPPYFDLYNISQLVVRTDQAKRAFNDDASQFEKERDFGQTALYRWKGVPSGYVVVPRKTPVLYTGKNWAADFYEWFKSPRNLEQLYVPDGFVEDPADRLSLKPSVSRLPHGYSEAPPSGSNFMPAAIKTDLTDSSIRFITSRVGEPHLIKVSYFPNWKVIKGAKGVYPVSPHFMLVIPREKEVLLQYGYTFWDKAGILITIMTCLIVLAAGIQRKMRIPMLSGINAACGRVIAILTGFAHRVRPPFFWFLMTTVTAMGIYGLVYRNMPVRHFIEGNRLFQEGMNHKSANNHDDAEKAFNRAIEKMHPVIENRKEIDHQDIINCILFSAMCRENLGQFDKAVLLYRLIISEYPYSRAVSEAYVKVSRLARQDRAELRNELNAVIDKGDYPELLKTTTVLSAKLDASLKSLHSAISADPYSHWAGYARTELTQESTYIEAFVGELEKAKAGRPEHINKLLETYIGKMKQKISGHNNDGTVKSIPNSVTPAKAGVYNLLKTLDYGCASYTLPASAGMTSKAKSRLFTTSSIIQTLNKLDR